MAAKVTTAAWISQGPDCAEASASGSPGGSDSRIARVRSIARSLGSTGGIDSARSAARSVSASGAMRPATSSISCRRRTALAKLDRAAFSRLNAVERGSSRMSATWSRVSPSISWSTSTARCPSRSPASARDTSARCRCASSCSSSGRGRVGALDDRAGDLALRAQAMAVGDLEHDARQPGPQWPRRVVVAPPSPHDDEDLLRQIVRVGGPDAVALQRAADERHLALERCRTARDVAGRRRIAAHHG